MNSTLLTYTKQKTTTAITKWCLSLFLLMGLFTATAQVNTYTKEQLASPGYTDLNVATKTIVFGGVWDNNAAVSIPIGFSFNFNGTNYANAFVSPNGFITLGGTAPVGTDYFPLNNAIGQGAIAAYAWDLAVNASFGTPQTNAVSYELTGTAPNRILKIEWRDAFRRQVVTPFTLDTASSLSMQLWLYETTNVVETHYKQQGAAAYTVASTGQVGLRGTITADFNNWSLTTNVNWPAPPGMTSGGAGNATVRIRAAAGVLGATSVRLFRWTPNFCNAPGSLAVSNVLISTATLTYTIPSPTPASYQYEIRTGGAPGTALGPNDVSGTVGGAVNTINITGLTPDTTYTAYIRSQCGGPNSGWVSVGPFTTLCTALTVPYLQDFEGTTAPTIPPCTSIQNIGTGNLWSVANADGESGFFDNHLMYLQSGTQAANVWFFTEGIQLTAGTTYQMDYQYGGTSVPTSITNRMEVRYGLQPRDPFMTLPIDNHPNIKGSPTNNIVFFTAPTTDVYYFGFRAYSLAAQGKLFLEEIQIIESNCRVPTGLQAPPVLVSFNNATITWTAPTPSPLNGYAYYISTSNVPPANNTPPSGVVPVGTTLTVIPSLTPNTTYYVWVRSICGPGLFGEWSANTTFTTLPAPPVYCIPVGTSVDGQGITNVTFGSINNTTGNEAATSFYGNYSGLTTNVAQGATIPVFITFNTAPFDYNTHIWVDWNNDGDFFDPGELVYTGLSGTTNPSVLNASFTVPLAQPLGPRRLRIGGTDFGPFADPCRTGSWQSYEDYTINVIVAPPALTLSQTTMPAQCGLTNSPLVTITSNIADFDVYTWTPSTGVTGTPTTGYTFNTNATTTYILTASQTSGAFSTNTVTFTYVANETPTPITITTPNGTVGCVNGPAIELNASGGIVSNLVVYSEDFNSGINGPGQFTTTNASFGGSNPANAAWTVRPQGYVSFAAFTSNDNTSFVLADSDSQGSGATSTTRVNLISPPIDLTTYVSATASFFHFYQRYFTDDFVRVEVTTNAGASWTTLVNYTTTQGTASNFAQAFLNLNPYVGNIIQIRFNYETNWGWGWAIDNFRVLGSATSAIVWTPATGLYTNPAATVPYVAGTGANVVYAMPSTDTVYQAAVTGPAPTLCQSTQTVAITVTPQVGGTLSGNQVSCEASSFTPITLTGHVGNILRWEYADDAAFTSGITTIANTSTTLTPAEFGTFQSIRYFRAVIGAGSCNPVYSTVSSVSNNVTILTGTNTWSNGLPAINKKVIIAGNYTATADFAACSIQVLTGATLTINSGVTVTVQNEFVVDGPSLPNTVVFQNGSTLLQNTDATNSGSIRYIRNSSPIIQYDYTYWSSPVANQVLSAFSPNTNANRFYVFDHTVTNYQWLTVSNASVMTAAKGYIIRAPNTISTTVPAPWAGEFYGVPNNGPYSMNVVLSGNGDRNLLGNPYPSAIFADDLYNENSSVLNGNFYFWTHNTPITANNYNANDYASYNGVGGVGTAAPTTGVNTSIPSGNIGAGQGFFVGAAATGTVNFNNTIRVYGNNNQFYRSGGIKVETESVEKHRLWINLINNQGAYKQTLIGYIQGATNERDQRFDADLTEAGNSVSIYSLLNQDKLTIQGRALPFQVTDVIPMGVRTTLAGEYTVQLENFDGLFAQGQNVYLEDKLLGIVHDLKQGDYTFSTTGGTINDRFEIQFEEGALSVNNPKDLSNAIIVYKNNEIIFVNAGNEIMTEVKLFDARGRLITTKSNIQTSEVQFDGLQVANQLLLIQITTENGEKVTKKIAY